MITAIASGSAVCGRSPRGVRSQVAVSELRELQAVVQSEFTKACEATGAFINACEATGDVACTPAHACSRQYCDSCR